MSMNGKQIARIATELARAWREEHRTNGDAAAVLEQLANTFEQREGMDEGACLALLSQLEVATTTEWELIDELRLAIESRAWERHPSRKGTVAGTGRGVSAVIRT